MTNADQTADENVQLRIVNDARTRLLAYVDELDRIDTAMRGRLQNADEIHSINGLGMSRTDLRMVLNELSERHADVEWGTAVRESNGEVWDVWSSSSRQQAVLDIAAVDEDGRALVLVSRSKLGEWVEEKR